MIRIRIVQQPALTVIDGVALDHFQTGQVYDVGQLLGALFLAEGWAVPVAPDSEPLAAPAVQQAAAKPSHHANVIREVKRPYSARHRIAADLRRRRKT